MSLLTSCRQYPNEGIAPSRASVPCREMVISASTFRIPEDHPDQLAEQQGKHTTVDRPRLHLHTIAHPENHVLVGPCQHQSVLSVHCFGKWNFLVANPRKGLHGRVVQNGGPHRALGLALEHALAVLSHGWIDLDTPRRRRRASHDEQSGDSGHAYHQPPHGFGDLLTYQHLDSRGDMFCWK
jgi:hypothetical protein